jgi:Pyruvate/2-oxoglutarate dehydrogenase complex, dihydrolipoamide acyltransferase (E2) component, and related enzymes
MEQLTEIRQQLKKTLKDVKLTYMPFFMKALSLAILDYPIINSSLLDSKNEYILKSSHNISFAMDTPLGLVVPNIKNVESKSILEIASEMSRIQELGQKGRLSDNDLSDGTVALSNIGSIGGTYAAPVILPPQVFIGALGTIRPRLEKVDGIITEKNILATSWSADHRIIDGATTARFVARWKALIENPSLMLLHLK